MEKLTPYLDKLIVPAVAYAPKFVLAIVTLVVGLLLIRWVMALLRTAMDRKKVDSTLLPFLSGVVSALLKVALVVSVASMVGIQTTSFVAVLGAAGLAVGLALQGSMTNFAGGILLLVFRPFKVGDLIEAQGYLGTVSEIGILHTIMKSPDNKTIVIPNGPLAGGPLVNFTTEPTRRVDFVFSVAYRDSIKKARDTLTSLIENDDRILDDPKPMIVVGQLGDHSVNLTVRVWCKTEDYWGVFFDLLENAKNAFDEKGITIPFPQRDVHLFNEGASQRLPMG